MTAPTTPSPERQPADAVSEAEINALHEALGGDGWAYSNYGNDERSSHRSELIAGVLAIRNLDPAPQAQPDARAVEARKKLQSWLDDFDRENADDIDNDDFNIGQDELIEVPTEDLRRVLQALSAPAADDGWRPSREEVARAIDPVLANAVFDGPYAPRSAMGLALEAADRVLALHPAAPTDEVGKS